MCDNQKRITDETEEVIVGKIFKEYTAGEKICDLLETDWPPEYKLRIIEPIIKKNALKTDKPGDIDVLVLKNNEADKAMAIECKRIKVVAIDSEEDKINKLEEIKKGFEQAEGLCKMGFYKTFLLIIVEGDVALRTGILRSWFSSIKGEKCKSIQDKINSFYDSSKHKFGVIYFEWTQTTTEAYEDRGGISAQLIHGAAETGQDDELTQKVKAIFQRK